MLDSNLLKHMNRFIKVFLGTAIVGALSSCEDFLTKNPPDKISIQTFWKSETDAEMALAGIYSRLLNNTFDINQLDWDAISDDFFLFGTYGRIDNIAKGIVEPTTGGVVEAIYRDAYRGVSSCNVFLDNIDRTPVSEEKKNAFKAEALFLRSLFYFTLTEFYGGVPFYLTAATLENAFVTQTAKAEIISRLVTDLDFAITHLPDAAYKGHAVKGSAQALKAKILLHQGKWAEAADAALQVMQSGKFSLSGKYPDLFLAARQENNPEIIFSARYLNPDRYATEGADMKYGASLALNARQDFVDEFECTDGKPISESPLYRPDSIFKNRDPRLSFTIRHVSEPIVNPDNGMKHVSSVSGLHSPYAVRKYVDPTHLPLSYATRSDQDFVLLRYAEVLLIYAEARNEASGPDQGVYDAVNQVRNRPGVKMPPLPAGLDKEGMRLKIRHERRVELGAEGRRYLDLKRWKIAETVIPSIVDPGGVRRNFDPSRHYVFPFPQSEVDVNTSLRQNPNY